MCCSVHDVWSSNSVEDMLLIVDRIFFTVSGLILTASLLKKKRILSVKVTVLMFAVYVPPCAWDLGESNIFMVV